MSVVMLQALSYKALPLAALTRGFRLKVKLLLRNMIYLMINITLKNPSTEISITTEKDLATEKGLATESLGMDVSMHVHYHNHTNFYRD